MRPIYLLPTKTSVMALMILFLNSCIKADEPPQNAYLSFTHASPDGLNLDLYINRYKINHSPISFFTSMRYMTFQPRENHIRVTQYNTNNTISELYYTLKDKTYYSLFLVKNDDKNEFLLVEDNHQLPKYKTAGVRNVHLSPHLGEVIIRVSNENQSIVQELGYLEINDFENFDMGVYNIEVLRKETGQKIAEASNVQFQNRRLYSLMLSGQMDKNGTNNLTLKVITNRNMMM